MSAVEEPFLMPVEVVFRRGRQTMPTGRIERGRVRTGDEVQLVGPDRALTAHVTGIDLHGRHVDEASAGMHVGLLLHGTAGTAVGRGHVLAAPGAIDAHHRFTADLALLSEADGGTEVRTGDRLQFHVRTATVLGVVTLPPGADPLQPLHQGTVTVALDHPVALETGRRLAFRHHARAAGTATVTRLG
ncbi:EF-Tu/IF-2/RF-3 family GTPase [Kitasatospora terrestris]|uniref:Translation elongation factor EFTu/EF1A C-terminal domain-containing protein n=1 Tax=Kitasatospora terrestris TaxID=258051 RepID=A0ABP9DD14_9ACTN